MAFFLDTIFGWLPKLRKPDQTLEDAQCDADGNLLVAIAADATGTTTWVGPAPGTPLTFERLIASEPARLYQVFGINEGGDERWVMLFDLDVLAADGAEPVFSMRVPDGTFFSLDLRRPRAFVDGIAWAVSSTPGTLTRDTGALVRINFEIASP